MDGQLRKLGISYERYAAVDGSTLPGDGASVFAPIETWLCIRRPTNGEIGCYLSHRAVLQLIDERGYERACILEDDVELSPDFASYLRDDLPMPDGVGILKLEIARARCRLRAIKRGKFAGADLVSVPRDGVWGTAAYIATREAAKKLLLDTAIMRNLYDEQIFDYHNGPVRYLHVFPLPALQIGSSTIPRHNEPKRKRTPFQKLRYELTAKPLKEIRLLSKEFRLHRKHFGFRAACLSLVFPTFRSTGAPLLSRS
jgi:glycosyl transferase family 25